MARELGARRTIPYYFAKPGAFISKALPDKHHDALTIVAIAVVAFVVADLSHEALGHGLVAYLSGARQIVLSYTYLSSDLQSRWISAAGPLVNLGEGLLALVLLRTLRMPPPVAYFFFLVFCFNLLVGAAYLVYSGVTGFGDPAATIAGLPYLTAIRVAMGLTGIVLYGSVVAVGGRQMRRFAPDRDILAAGAYFTALSLNCCAGLLNPLGLKYFLISALPTTMAANAGLFAMPGIAKRDPSRTNSHTVERSYVWCAAGLITAVFFIFLVGPGLTLRH